MKENYTKLARDLMWMIHVQRVEQVVRDNKKQFDQNMPMSPMVVMPPTQDNVNEVIQTIMRAADSGRSEALLPLIHLVDDLDNDPDPQLKKNKAYQALRKKLNDVYSEIRGMSSTSVALAK